MNTSKSIKTTILKFYHDMLNKRRLDEIAGIVSPAYRNSAGGGPETILQGANQLLKAFPDIQWHIEEIVAEDNTVIVKQITTGTHMGTFQGYEPTSKPFTGLGYALYHFEQGKIVRHHVLTDRFGFLQQIGVIE